MKDWVKVAFELSEKTRLYIAYLVTSNQADGGGTVAVHANQFPERTFLHPTRLDPAAISPDERVIIPPHTVIKEKEVLERRFPELLGLAKDYGLNRILYGPDAGKKQIGFITSSLAYCYLEHALNMVGLGGSIPILKYGITHPVDADILREFVGMVDDVVRGGGKSADFWKNRSSPRCKPCIRPGKSARFGYGASVFPTEAVSRQLWPEPEHHPRGAGAGVEIAPRSHRARR